MFAYQMLSCIMLSRTGRILRIQTKTKITTINHQHQTTLAPYVCETEKHAPSCTMSRSYPCWQCSTTPRTKYKTPSVALVKIDYIVHGGSRKARFQTVLEGFVLWVYRLCSPVTEEFTGKHLLMVLLQQP